MHFFVECLNAMQNNKNTGTSVWTSSQIQTNIVLPVEFSSFFDKKKNKIIYLNGTSTHFMHHETMLSKFNGMMIQFTINLFFCPHNIYNFSKIYLEQIFHNTYVFILWEFTNLGEELTINFFFFLQDTGYLKVFFVLGSCTLFKYEWKLIWIEDRKLNHIYFEYVNPFQ